MQIMTHSHIAVSDRRVGEMTSGEAGAKAVRWEDYPSEDSGDYSNWDE